MSRAAVQQNGIKLMQFKVWCITAVIGPTPDTAIHVMYIFWRGEENLYV